MKLLKDIPGFEHGELICIACSDKLDKIFFAGNLIAELRGKYCTSVAYFSTQVTAKEIEAFLRDRSGLVGTLHAIDLEDKDLLCEELGDLLMQVVFHARMAEEAGLFSMQDVIDGITEKLIRRHPHVFGDINVKDADEVLTNWEAIKRAEKKDRKSVLDGVPKDFPALMAAYKLQHKAAKVGFEWPDVDPVWDKLREEVEELEEATVDAAPERIEEELGDVLFTIVNLARFLKIDPEIALTAANRKFKRRFSYIENKVKEKQQKWEQLSLLDLDDLWQEAKMLEEDA